MSPVHASAASSTLQYCSFKYYVGVKVLLRYYFACRQIVFLLFSQLVGWHYMLSC